MPQYIIRRASKYGFIDEEGNEVIKPTFERVSEFNEGFAWAVIEKSGKWVSGFINENGSWVIDPIFSGYGWPMSKTSLFSEGLAPIQADNGKMMYINKQGEPITGAAFEEAYHFSENMALVCQDGLYGYIDRSGNQAIDCQFGVIRKYTIENSYFSHGLAAVRFLEKHEEEGNCGYIDKNGEFVFEPEDYDANAFKEGFAMVKDKFEYYFIDPEGNMPIAITTISPTSFSEGLADMYDSEIGAFGFINSQSKWVIQPEYQETLRFTEGLASIKRFDRQHSGYIDKNGEMVIHEKFDVALPFKNGLARVQKGGKSAYINKLGDFIWKES